jgi:hypothetical protein
MVMPSAPPSSASAAAQTGSGSYDRRAWRSDRDVIDVNAEFDHRDARL